MKTELKTLKDLGYNFIDHDGKKQEYCDGCIGCDEGCTCDIKRVIDEAIKWIKALKSDIKKIGVENPTMLYAYSIDYWMNFFNLTEEDLKDG